jgi:hypothetical protein
LLALGDNSMRGGVPKELWCSWSEENHSHDF